MREAIGANFKGATCPENTILVTTNFPFQEHLKDLSGVNKFFWKKGTFSLLRLPDLWHISLNPAEGQKPEQALTDKSIQAQTGEVLPNALDLGIVEKRVYGVHRRVATHYRKSRMFIAGDTAQLNSRKGGMGMNEGIHDAWRLADLLIDTADVADPSRLDTYQARRIPVERNDIVAQADRSQSRMNTTDEAKRFIQLRRLQGIAGDPFKARQFLLRPSMINGLQRSEKLVR